MENETENRKAPHVPAEPPSTKGGVGRGGRVGKPGPGGLNISTNPVSDGTAGGLLDIADGEQN